jgi:hypothetical protein
VPAAPLLPERAITRSRRASAPSVSRITLWIFIVVNGFLALVTLAALIGIWFGGTSAVRTYSVHAGLHDVPSRHLLSP